MVGGRAMPWRIIMALEGQGLDGLRKWVPQTVFLGSKRIILAKRNPNSEMAYSRELTYPTLGKGNSSSKLPWKGIC